MVIQDLRKNCHFSQHVTQLPGLNLALESLWEAARVPQVPPQSSLFTPMWGWGRELAIRAAVTASQSSPPGQGRDTLPKCQRLPLLACLEC